ncbi:amidohydrolase/deacetylase family metallohydrolase [Xenorhabdus lircayensis]|uniref:Amidohydrolase/deacetylase family metallohydrolase n=1 Tax=Xenorhabdus lircayensis TaxID=2763499 RepID=A0ABS0U2P5_9GAMM|nr:amidohydrolase/deacetylase family metallohydrolase [Xenorhabdus lircayensis]MBI6547764.1 amidohydrolase/deacetylase family metallohydrolase [Xenorhabdus lircayensis]
MNDLIIKQGTLINGDIIDIVINDGRITAIGPSAATGLASIREIDLHGHYHVSAGWIDAHTHCNPQSPLYFDEPDLIGASSGVTTVVDAGSTGADDIDHFYTVARKAKTHVYAFLNIARTGICRQNELADMAQIDNERLQNAVRRHKGFIIGLKARMSKSVIGDNRLLPLIKAKIMQRANGLPLMVHIGNPPPNLEDIADLLTKGDIITHCFNGKPNRILDDAGNLKQAIQRALARGVILDVGHGTESLSFSVAEQAIKFGAHPHMISSDIYQRNRVGGPVYSLATVMTKFLNMGLSPEYILNCVTINAANLLHLPRKGRLERGYDGDITIFELKNQRIKLVDAEGQIRIGTQQFIPIAAIIAGVHIVVAENAAAKNMSAENIPTQNAATGRSRVNGISL